MWCTGDAGSVPAPGFERWGGVGGPVLSPPPSPQACYEYCTPPLFPKRKCYASENSEHNLQSGIVSASVSGTNACILSKVIFSMIVVVLCLLFFFSSRAG